MADWTDILTDDRLPGEPWTSAKANAVYENPIALAEGAPGAPTLEVAWHYLESATRGTDGTTVTFATDISAYRSIKIIGGAALGAQSSTLRIQTLSGAGSWATFAEITPTTLVGTDLLSFLVDFQIHNVDRSNGSNYRFGSGVLMGGARGSSDDWGDPAFYVPSGNGLAWGSRNLNDTMTAVRISSTAGIDVSEGAPVFWLYGAKATQP